MQLNNISHTKEWSLNIQERRFKWFGHLQRLPKEAPARLAYEEVTQKPVKKKKLEGGQPLTWLKTIKRYLHSINLSLGGPVKYIAQDKYQQEIVFRVRERQNQTPHKLRIFSQVWKGHRRRRYHLNLRLCN